MRHRTRSGVARLFPWLEAIITAVIGLVLFFPFDNADLALLTWIVGSLLTVNRLSFEARLERELAPVQRLAEIVDLEQDVPIEEIRSLLQTYLRILEPEFQPVRDSIIRDTSDRLLKLANDKTSEDLGTSEYYSWLLPILDRSPRGSIIRALSTMLEGEWSDSPAERRFKQGTEEAAERGVEVQRIFVTSREQFHSALENEPLRMHTRDGLSGYFVDIEDLKSADPSLLAELGDGFIAFDDRVALIDISRPDGQARGRVTMNPAEIGKLIQQHEHLKVFSVEMKPDQIPAGEPPVAKDARGGEVPE